MKSSKAKWIPFIEYSSREDLARFSNEIPDDFDKYNEVEVAVVREDNKFGFESAGWPCEDKIILFGTSAGLEYDNDKEADEVMDWWTLVANVVADALNKEGL